MITMFAMHTGDVITLRLSVGAAVVYQAVITLVSPQMFGETHYRHHPGHHYTSSGATFIARRVR